ncbi:HlyD family secretion protein [Bacteriovorax sp. BAL6_X]|uniref:HlyD family efflux transporter periplasmic adaptor subunit n=1 Tax=Bacteriovorax sp. BAL6_X TaxID=1201290 RepID=UPI000386A3A4|nr:HlyD family efflux transporter periplasmic adaptor subunit [Bacteriovorax sp. BAL6_X]EPZ51145.1 HlyD family secretion protein [Bacteriovorax sp. BAL6_X]
MKSKRNRFSFSSSIDYAKQTDYIGQDLLLEEARIPYVSKSIILLSLFAIVAFFVWSSFSTVNEIVQANGEIETTATIHFIKHNKPGVLDSLEVMTGQYVKAGDLLYTLVDERKNKGTNSVTKEILLIRSPITGIVNEVDYKAIGTNVSKDRNIVKIYPISDSPIATVKFTPKDLSFIQEGMTVKIKVTSHQTHRNQIISGRIESISPNIFYTKNGLSYYQAKVLLSKNYLGHNQESNLILPGMQVHAAIQISKRSILNYLLKPIDTSLSYALTER